MHLVGIIFSNQCTIIVPTNDDMVHLNHCWSVPNPSRLFHLVRHTFNRFKHQSSALSLLKSRLWTIFPRFLWTNISSGNTFNVSVSIIKLSLHPTHKICGFGVPDDGMKSRGTGRVRYRFRMAVLKSKGIFEDEVEIHLISFSPPGDFISLYTFSWIGTGFHSNYWNQLPPFSRRIGSLCNDAKPLSV